ncbi:MAG: type II toxin-antitoxin system YafQ family toxin [Mangrovibacterium sp.]
MKQLLFSSKYKKDLKRYRNQPKKVIKLQKVLTHLIKGETLPSEYKAHYLKGQYKGCLECHIEDDFLLIWIDEEKNTIQIMRLGSHSELFR